MVRSHLAHGGIPWRRATLSGWILDPDRKKMSKSKGNVVTPIDLFDKYGSDAVRYWAASARPGVDTAFSEDQMKVGGKLANKLLNVSKFVMTFGGSESGAVTSPLDCAMLSRLSGVVAEATLAFDDFDYARALERTESFFWWFCDDFVELVKTRAYGTGGVDGVPATTNVSDESLSARHALTRAISILQRLLAPHMPFCTDEVWSWWHNTSVHGTAWPTSADTGSEAPSLAPSLTAPAAEQLLHTVSTVLAEIRRTKTEAKVSQRAAVSQVVITCDASRAFEVTQAQTDLVNAGNVAEFKVVDGATLSVNVTLAPAS
jgi:valyl-tRNA synthetase